MGTPNKDNYSGSSISPSMVAKRKSRIEDNEYVSYVIVPNDVTIDIFSLIQICFGIVSEY